VTVDHERTDAVSVTVHYDGVATETASANASGDDLWLSLDELRSATGWEAKPQGLCHGERCVPIPAARRAEFFTGDGRFNLAGFARHIDQPFVHDDRAGVWLFGEAPATRRDALRSLEAPDFTLPDLDGTLWSLSQFRGTKVLLLTWASW
jgi:hypothetical protein